MGTGRGHWLILAAVTGLTAGVGARKARAQVEVYAAPGGEVVEEGVAYPATPPPDLIPEYPPPSPGYGYMWVNGYWDWTGVDWSWNSGFWTPRQAGVTFYAPRFVFVNGEPVYYRGYWVDPYGRREYGYGWRGAPPPAYRARPSVAPGYWRAQHSEGWRRYPGAPAVWRAPARGPGYRPGGRPVEARPYGRPGEPVREGFHGGPAPMNHPAMAARPGAPAAPHPVAAPAPHAAAAPHPAGNSRKK